MCWATAASIPHGSISFLPARNTLSSWTDLDWWDRQKHYFVMRYSWSVYHHMAGLTRNFRETAQKRKPKTTFVLRLWEVRLFLFFLAGSGWHPPLVGCKSRGVLLCSGQNNVFVMEVSQGLRDGGRSSLLICLDVLGSGSAVHSCGFCHGKKRENQHARFRGVKWNNGREIKERRFDV